MQLQAVEKVETISPQNFKENYYFNGKFLDTAVYCLLNPSSNKK